MNLLKITASWIGLFMVIGAINLAPDVPLSRVVIQAVFGLLMLIAYADENKNFKL